MGGSVIDQFPFKCWLCETPSSETLWALKSVSQVTRNWSHERIAENAIVSHGASAHQSHNWSSRRPTDIIATDLDQIVTSGSCVWQKQASSAFLEWQSYLQSKQNVSALSRSPHTQFPVSAVICPCTWIFFIGCRISADESTGLKEPGPLKQKKKKKKGTHSVKEIAGSLVWNFHCSCQFLGHGFICGMRTEIKVFMLKLEMTEQNTQFSPILATWKWCSKAPCCKIQMQCL